MAHGPRSKTCAECGRGFRHGRYLAYCSRLCERTASVKVVAVREAARAVVGVALGLELSEVWFDRAALRGLRLNWRAVGAAGSGRGRRHTPNISACGTIAKSVMPRR